MEIMWITTSFAWLVLAFIFLLVVTLRFDALEKRVVLLEEVQKRIEERTQELFAAKLSEKYPHARS